MIRILVFFLFINISFASSNFMKSVAPPELVFDYKHAKYKEKNGFAYQEIKIKLVYPAAMLAFLPAGVFMEAGLAIQETYYNSMINSRYKPIIMAERIRLLTKLLRNQRLTKEEIKFLREGFSMHIDFKYQPFLTRIDERKAKYYPEDFIIKSYIEDDITFKSYDVIKVDVLNKNGFNFFFIFPKDKKKPLVINDLIIPPMVFCDYNGVFYLYKLDLEHKRAKFYAEQLDVNFNKSEYRDIRVLSLHPTWYNMKFLNNMIKTPEKIINRHINLFIKTYLDYLKADL